MSVLAAVTFVDRGQIPTAKICHMFRLTWWRFFLSSAVKLGRRFLRLREVPQLGERSDDSLSEERKVEKIGDFR